MAGDAGVSQGLHVPFFKDHPGCVALVLFLGLWDISACVCAHVRLWESSPVLMLIVCWIVLSVYLVLVIFPTC